MRVTCYVSNQGVSLLLAYAHDKRRDGEAVRLTADRVAWVETVNLPTGDPERAWRIMAHTALAQGHLKAAAGTKATGRKLKTPCSPTASHGVRAKDRPKPKCSRPRGRATKRR